MRVAKTYCFDFDHPVDKLWAVVSDTPRWGEAAGFPRYQASEQLQPDGTVAVFGRIELAGIEVRWQELPADWVAGCWFEQRRLFSRGPIAGMTTIARLEDRGDTSRLQLELVFETGSLIGKMVARRLLGAYQSRVSELLAAADSLIRAERPELFETSYRPAPASLERARKIAGDIAQTPYEHGLAQRLVDFINHTQEVDLWVMRPIAIARRWGVATREVIELFLQSVRSGLLESRWDILCPRCRVSMNPVVNMSDLPHGVHCDACNIDFEADFSRNVELCFAPSPAIRPIGSGYFCRSGPGVTPHIKTQCTLAAGAGRGLPLVLPPGDYRARTLEAGGEVRFSWQGGAFPGIRVDGERIELDGESNPGEISLINAGRLARTVVIEEQDWLQDVLTADQVTTLQAFRDLFSDQVLRPGDEVRIRNISFMFTDLVGSTALFSEIGDAGAYRLVREHFAEIGDIVRRHQGNIVKTVGDGVHAAFSSPDDALRAAIEIQHAMPAFNRRLGLGRVATRIGLHAGSSISVTLNDRLDYYGEAVNLAARLEGQGAAGEITMSSRFAEDPGVAAILQKCESRRNSVSLKGLEQPIQIVQLTPGLRDVA